MGQEMKKKKQFVFWEALTTSGVILGGSKLFIFVLNVQ